MPQHIPNHQNTAHNPSQENQPMNNSMYQDHYFCKITWHWVHKQTVEYDKRNNPICPIHKKCLRQKPIHKKFNYAGTIVTRTANQLQHQTAWGIVAPQIQTAWGNSQ